ncbi:MAG: hypothetical protein Ta2D_00490 [Rickettsiales bacterium]|nr:MAG: hypothetical protein Ta2D_00490 [Rickettsiales bacterium]
MVNNDYLSFCNLKDLKKYAEEHKVFDSETISMFHRAYIPNLADINFNEHYYLNKEYSGKNVLQLADERQNYLAGIDKLKSEGKIGGVRAYFAKRRLQKVLAREKKERKKLENNYYDNLTEKKAANFKLNKKALCDATKTEKEVLFSLDEFAIFGVSRPSILERLEQSREEAKNVEIVMDNEYMKCMLELKDWIKRGIEATDVALRDIPEEKERIRDRYLNSTKLMTKSEEDNLKKLKNEKNYDLQIAEKEVKKATWPFSNARKEQLELRFAQIEEDYAKKEEILMNAIKENKLKKYEEVKKLDENGTYRPEKAEISQINRVNYVGGKVLKEIGQPAKEQTI